MNYTGNEELRQDIARLSNDMDELQQRMMLLEQKYLWSNNINLSHALAGQVLRVARESFANVYKQIYELDLIFSY
ncbi:TPA: hypothetical protein JGU28_004705 [Salmonella enterica]|nr:hypothetical protein [Salmonella enterica]